MQFNQNNECMYVFEVDRNDNNSSISAKAVTFAVINPDMNENAFEMVPSIVERVAELLESIDSKLDKENVVPILTMTRGS